MRVVREHATVTPIVLASDAVSVAHGAMTRMKLGIAGALVLTASLMSDRLGAQQMSSDIPVNLFTRPTGPYTIGTYDWLWVDEHRPERYTKDPGDKRKLPVQVWYPAEPIADSTGAPYIRTPAEFGANAPFKALVPGYISTSTSTR